MIRYYDGRYNEKGGGLSECLEPQVCSVGSLTALSLPEMVVAAARLVGVM
jgi:hypothetical protein